MFHGSCHVDEIRRVYKECDYDINRAISVLIERQNGMTSAAIQEDLPQNIDRILERYGRFLDRESVETILRDNGNDYDIACVTIEQMYQISEDETPLQQQKKKNELVQRYQNQVDMAIIYAIIDECHEDLEQAMKQLDALVATAQPSPVPEVDAASLVFLIRSALLDFLPADAVDQFVAHNSISEALTVTRLEFLLNQILLVIASMTSLDDDQESANNDDILETILSQCDADMIPVDWTFTSSCNHEGQEISLLELLSVGTTPSQPELSPLEVVRQFLTGLVGSCSEKIIPDDMILSTLDANNYDVDRAICILSRTIEQLQEDDVEEVRSTTYSNRIKKNSGPRAIVSYASVLRTEVGPEIPSPYPKEFIETEVIAPSQPWKPSIVVVPLESQFHSDTAPQSPQGHLEQEQYWRSIQSEHRKSISRLITAKSKDGFRSIPAMCHEASRASAEASKHALLARNPGLVVGIEHNTLHFYGFNDRHIKLTTSSPSSRTPFEFSIDFHGVDVLSSVQFINSVLSYLKSSNVLANRKCVIHLVVGRGSHSKGGVSRLKPALKSFLLRKGYRISVLEGEITVHTG